MCIIVINKACVRTVFQTENLVGVRPFYTCANFLSVWVDKGQLESQ